MPNIIKTILNTDTLSLESMFPNVLSDDNGTELYKRQTCVGSLEEINTILAYLRSSAIDSISNLDAKKIIKDSITKMPQEFVSKSPQGISRCSTQNSSTNDTPIARPSSSGRLRNFADRVQNAATRSHQRLMHSSPSRTFTPEGGGNNGVTPEMINNDETNNINAEVEVLVFPLQNDLSPLGLESEEKFMTSFHHHRKQKISNKGAEKKTRFVATATESVVSDRTNTDAASDDEDDDDDEEEAAGSGLSLDEDEVEDVSTLPDNFSDVVPISANVSGRGSPSLDDGDRNSESGRGTPFSANAADRNGDDTNDDAAAVAASSTVNGAASNAPRPTMPPLPVTVRKQNPEGLEEKFGKFTIPPHDRTTNHDETYSLVSDSWSTDVVASDNEGIAGEHRDVVVAGVNPIQLAPPGGEGNRLRRNFSGNNAQPILPPPPQGPPPPIPPQQQNGPTAGLNLPEDRSDTWSLDATVSDSEADNVGNRNNDVEMMLLDDAAAAAAAVVGQQQQSQSEPSNNASRKNKRSSVGGSGGSGAAIIGSSRAEPSIDLPSRRLPTNLNASLRNQVDTESGNPNRLRRQSSGSSFYSKSDVDSEFAK